MSDFIVIEIGGKPEAKGRGRVGSVKSGGKTFATVFTPAHTRKYETRIRDAAAEAMKGRPPIEGAVSVVVKAFLLPPKSLTRKKLAAALKGEIAPLTKPDIDNYVKSALDGINNIVVRDDSQVTALYAAKAFSDVPRLRIEVHEIYKPNSLEEML